MVITRCVVVVGRLLEKTKEEEQHLTVIKAVLRIHNHDSQKKSKTLSSYIYIYNHGSQSIIFKTFKQLAIKPLVFITSSWMRIVGSN